MRRGAYLAAAAAGAVLLVATTGQAPQDPDHFEVNATYANGTVSLYFLDRSGGTEQVAVEILGMAETFRRVYASPHFEDVVPFPGPPKYGWGAHPVVLEVTHDSLGMVRIKTEVRDLGQPAAPVIFEK